jgi:hypothetical protein
MPCTRVANVQRARAPVQVRPLCMAAPEAVRCLRELLQVRLGNDHKDYTDEQLAQLIGKGYVNERRLRAASRDGLLAAGLNDGQADELRAAFQGVLCFPQQNGSCLSAWFGACLVAAEPPCVG